VKIIRTLSGPFTGRKSESTILARKLNEVIDTLNETNERTTRFERECEAGHELNRLRRERESLYGPPKPTHFEAYATAHFCDNAEVYRSPRTPVGQGIQTPHLLDVTWHRDYFYEPAKRHPLAIIAPRLSTAQEAADTMGLERGDWLAITSPCLNRGCYVRGYVILNPDGFTPETLVRIVEAVRPAVVR
jgi:hypothetical protein